MLGESRTLITKVRLGDLFFVRQPHKNHAARNRIDRKHIDFLICDAMTMRPLVGIELDDASHQRKDRKERDDFVDRVFAAAGLPVIHVPAARSYQPKELAEAIDRALAPNSPPPIP
jgi:very-short-patch-repair endonuclease